MAIIFDSSPEDIATAERILGSYDFRNIPSEVTITRWVAEGVKTGKAQGRAEILSSEYRKQTELADSSLSAILGILQDVEDGAYDSNKDIVRDIRKIVTKKWGGKIWKATP